MTTFFITGTDTGVGKTTVTVAVARAAVRRGRTVSCIKPVETGWVASGADAVRLRSAIADRQPLEQVCPFRFSEPRSPERAAALEGVRLQRSEIVRRIRALETLRPDLLLIEGAGGVLVPLTDSDLVVDVIAELACETVVVSRAGLGTINHTLLTLEALRHRSCRIRGVVVSVTEPADVSVATANAADIAKHGAVPVLGVFPHAVDTTPDFLATLAEQTLPITDLLARST